jgi:hypothetical protein
MRERLIASRCLCLPQFYRIFLAVLTVVTPSAVAADDASQKKPARGLCCEGFSCAPRRQFQGGGISGGLQEFSWVGKLLWEFHLASDMHHHHHDIEPLSNGNILMIAWETQRVVAP